jgi:hypothetical protein
MTQSQIRARVTALRLQRLARVARLFARLARLIEKPLTVESFLRGKGLDGGVLRSVWGTFGKRVKALYSELRGGRKPATVWQTVTSPAGKVREVEVAAYRLSDLPILQAVWNQFYAI